MMMMIPSKTFVVSYLGVPISNDLMISISSSRAFLITGRGVAVALTSDNNDVVIMNIVIDNV